MDARRASFTALATSLIRAVHTRCDRPPLFEDSFADRWLSDAEREALRERLLLTVTPEVRERVAEEPDRGRALDLLVHETPAYGGVVVRTRYTEDRLEAALERGIEQVVLLGAGLDAFAWRRPDLARRLRVVEIDHPATQDLKRRKLAAAGLELPARVELVAADLGSEPLDRVLERAPLRRGQPIFFSWLGVTPYLSRDRNLATLAALARCGAAGSEVVFDFLDAAALGASASPEARRMVEERAGTSEPFLSGFEPAKLESELAGVGLALVECLGPEEAEARYCAGRADGLRLRAPGYLALARTALPRAEGAGKP